MKRVLRPVLMAKQLGNEDMLTRVCVEAAQMVIPADQTKFNPDAIRVVKILGSGVEESRVLKGMVFNRDTEGCIKSCMNAKIAVFNSPMDFAQTETKGTVLLKNAEELLAFSEGEEKIIAKQIADIAATGVNMIVAGGKVGDLTQHFLDKHGIMVVRLLSKFELRRLCKSVGATPLPRVGPPTDEECGFCASVKITDIGGSRVCVFDQGDEGSSRVATIVVRGSTRNSMEDIERAVDDGVSVFKGYCEDPRMVAGAGASEMDIAHRLAAEADKIPGLEQYAMRKFAEALEVVPRALAENVGQRAAEVISLLNKKHKNGESRFGIDITSDYAAVCDATEAGVYDALNTKIWGFRLASEAAATVLRVDQIIMSKPAGGPKAPGGGPNRDP
jgi:T-complex protein 1 subunit theta